VPEKLSTFPYSFDGPYLCAVIVGTILAIATNWPVKALFLWVVRWAARQSPKTGGAGTETAAELNSRIEKHFDLPLAALVGCIERAIYVFAVITPAYDLIIAWLIMKAFHEWVSEGKDQPLSLPKLTIYQLYLVGNAISLIAGLIIGVLAAVLMVHLR
jgi:hypothetical protein